MLYHGDTSAVAPQPTAHNLSILKSACCITNWSIFTSRWELSMLLYLKTASYSKAWYTKRELQHQPWQPFPTLHAARPLLWWVGPVGEQLGSKPPPTAILEDPACGPAAPGKQLAGVPGFETCWSLPRKTLSWNQLPGHHRPEALGCLQEVAWAMQHQWSNRLCGAWAVHHLTVRRDSWQGSPFGREPAL